VEIGTGRKLREGKEVAVLSIGPIGVNVEKALEKAGGISVAHYDMRFLKPLDEGILREVATSFDKIVTVEDGVRNGGFGSAVCEWMSDHGFTPRVKRLGLPDSFVEHGTVGELQHIVGIDAEAILKSLVF